MLKPNGVRLPLSFEIRNRITFRSGGVNIFGTRNPSGGGLSRTFFKGLPKKFVNVLFLSIKKKLREWEETSRLSIL